MSNERSLISAPQIRAARGILNWSQDDLAEKTDLSITTIRKIESGHISPRDSTNDKIRNAFEYAGLEFIAPNGVRQKPDDITIYEGEAGAKDFMDEIYQTAIQDSQDIVQVWSEDAMKKFGTMVGDYHSLHIDRMIAAQNLVHVRCILTGDPTFMPSPYIEYRFLQKSYVDSVPFYIYGNKSAVIDIHSKNSGKIIVAHSKTIADAFRRQFVSMWEKGTPLVNPNSTLPKA